MTDVHITSGKKINTYTENESDMDIKEKSIPGKSITKANAIFDDTENENTNDIKVYEHNKTISKTIGTDYSYRHKFKWLYVTTYLIFQLLAIWGFSLVLRGYCAWQTLLWVVCLNYAFGIGTTVGAHRYFSHKSFKAKPVLKCLLLICQTMTGQDSVYTWVRDHRTHHLYVDTDGDPHNSRRGLFFSHIGWLIYKKHPLVIEYGKKINMNDVKADRMIMFQMKYYIYLYLMTGVAIPVCTPVYLWNESWYNSIMVCYFAHYVLSLHMTWTINSLAHAYGARPYDRNMMPTQNWFVSFINRGEGWHNYHHSFPWDYRCAEFLFEFNHSASIIRWFEKIGLAYDLKTASPEADAVFYLTLPVSPRAFSEVEIHKAKRIRFKSKQCEIVQVLSFIQDVVQVTPNAINLQYKQISFYLNALKK